MSVRVLSVDVPLDLRRTLGSVALGWGRLEPDGWWRTLRSPEGPATLHVSRPGPAVRVESWGPGAGWVLDRAADWIGLSDPLETFEPDHPVVGPLVRESRGHRQGRTGLVTEAALFAVIGQKVAGKEARRGLTGLARRFSDAAPGPRPDLVLPPDPERLAAAPYHAFHDLGIEKRRADTLRRVAAEAARLDRASTLPPEEVRRLLERIPGVGGWTSAETVAVSHGDPDAVSVGDFHHKHLVSWHLEGVARGTDERMLELLEPFRPHRGRVVRLLERAGRYPAFGPRRPLRSFEAS